MTKRKIDEITPSKPPSLSSFGTEQDNSSDTELDQEKHKQLSVVNKRFFKRRRKKIPKIVKDIVLERQNVRCNICYILWNIGFELDHVMPLSCNGSNDEDNLQLLCVKCHKYKTTFIDDYIRNKLKNTNEEITRQEIIHIHREKYRKLNENPNINTIADRELISKINMIIDNYHKNNELPSESSTILKNNKEKQNTNSNTNTNTNSNTNSKSTNQLIIDNIYNKITNKLKKWVITYLIKII
jgi:hypothetical protein